MKIQRNTKLNAADLSPYSPGRPAKASSSRPLTAFDLAPLQPGRPEQPAAIPTRVDGGDRFQVGNPVKSLLPTQPLKLDPTTGYPAPTGAQSAQPQHDQAVEQAQKWVSQTFFGTLLKQMGDSPFKSDLFSGGRGGEAFSSLYHQQLADRMARGAGSKLVNSIVRSIEAKQEKGSGFGVQGSEKKSEGRPLNTQDPRTKAYVRPRPANGKQSTFSLAA